MLPCGMRMGFYVYTDGNNAQLRVIPNRTKLVLKLLGGPFFWLDCSVSTMKLCFLFV